MRFGVRAIAIRVPRVVVQPRSPGRDQFFAAFGKFRGADVADQVAEVVDRAGSQHVLYVELMVSLRSGAVRALGRQTGLAGGLAAARERLLAAGLAAEVAAARADLDGVDRRVEGHLGCQTEPRPGCRVTRRYLQHSQRTLSPEEVFAQLVFAFALAEGDPRVVGVNLVGPEDDATALGDYGRHMEMVGFLRGLHPGVGVTLHAGELTLGLVPPAHLRSHIRQAVEVAGARRIGHGTGLAYEDGALGLLGDLRERDVVVEICLTSNDVILGVRGDQHPFRDYLRAGVPVVLGSDDEGVARIDLTHEYERAAGYGLGYGELKDLSRNGLTYGFLPGESLWSGAAGSTVAACAGDPPGAPSPTAPCAAFLAGSERARLQWRLEAAFREFEDLPWW